LRGRAGLGLGLLAAGALGLVHCGREQAPAPAVPAPRTRPRDHGLEPWRWHMVGGLLVIEGELDQPEQLTLKGQHLAETVQAPLGPVRWELYRPPPGEVAELRGEDGRVLAT